MDGGERRDTKKLERVKQHDAVQEARCLSAWPREGDEELPPNSLVQCLLQAVGINPVQEQESG